MHSLLRTTLCQGGSGEFCGRGLHHRIAHRHQLADVSRQRKPTRRECSSSLSRKSLQIEPNFLHLFQSSCRLSHQINPLNFYQSHFSHFKQKKHTQFAPRIFCTSTIRDSLKSNRAGLNPRHINAPGLTQFFLPKIFLCISKLNPY